MIVMLHECHDDVDLVNGHLDAVVETIWQQPVQIKNVY